MSNRWIIKVWGPERVDVLRSGRQVRADVSAVDAKRYIKSHAMPGDEVFTEDVDGYRDRLSPSSRRRGKR